VPEAEFQFEQTDGGSATVRWRGDVAPELLMGALRAAAEDALTTGGLRRLEVTLSAGDAISRRAALRAGFRLEGVRRQVRELPDGTFEDEVLLARLATDLVSGPTGFSGVMNSALPKKRLIAHVLMRTADGRILLCETQFKTDWELPGGIVEPGETPRLGAVREVREELGIDLAVGRLLVADWMPPYLGWDDAIELIFDGGLVSADQLDEFVLQPAEIKRVRLCTLEEARELITPLSHRRLQMAAGLRAPETVYLEDGTVPQI
jgi:8-oxo-dGTP pyrophosphatase MutT (NUDIX family)